MNNAISFYTNDKEEFLSKSGIQGSNFEFEMISTFSNTSNNPTDAMEIITDKPIIVTATDKNGNTLYYEVDSNGKKKRVGKDYAKSLGVE